MTLFLEKNSCHLFRKVAPKSRSGEKLSQWSRKCSLCGTTRPEASGLKQVPHGSSISYHCETFFKSHINTSFNGARLKSVVIFRNSTPTSSHFCVRVPTVSGRACLPAGR